MNAAILASNRRECLHYAGAPFCIPHAMAQLKDKLENALNETRILLLGAQVLIGFYFRAFFEPGFPKLPPAAQFVEISALGIMLVGLGLLTWPAAYHRIAEQGRLTSSFHRFITSTMCVALLPFVLSIGSYAYFPLQRVFGNSAGVVGGVVAAVVSLACWYGLALLARKKRQSGMGLHAIVRPGEHKMAEQSEENKLSEKIKEVLIETRMVLPGAQALLGFQFITIFMDRFQAMPHALRILHVASMLSVALCTVLLITPAAYHRLAEAGEDSEEFHGFASRILLTAMVFLGLGVSGDFCVVLLQGTQMPALSIVISALLLLFYFAIWFGYPTWKARQMRAQEAR
jgi:Family of unknown function (DUF6328)